MALKAILDSLDNVSEALREFYKQDGEVFVLQVDGVQKHPDVTALANALERQKEDNRTLRRKLDEANDKLAGLPDDFTLDEWNRLKDSGEGKVEERLKEQRERLQAQHQKEVERLREETQTLKSRLQKNVAERALDEAIDKAGVDPKFRRAVKALHASALKIEGDGDEVQVLLGDLPVTDALQAFVASDEGKHFVAPPSGGGAPGSRGGGGGERNPWSKEHFNLTEQARILREDPAKAERLKAQA